MAILKPKNKAPWTFTLSISNTKHASEAEAEYLKSRFTIFLGQGRGFDYWGDPNSGYVISVGNDIDGTRSSNYGGAHHWRLVLSQTTSIQTTDAGRDWGK